MEHDLVAGKKNMIISKQNNLISLSILALIISFPSTSE